MGYNLQQLKISGLYLALVFAVAFIAPYLPNRPAFILIKLMALPSHWAFRALYYVIKFVVSKPFRYLVNKIKRKILERNLDKNIYMTLPQIDVMDLVKNEKGQVVRSGKWFESYVANLYRRLGHDAFTTTEMREDGSLYQFISKKGGSGEQGVDVVVKFNDENKGRVLLLQCKHYSKNVGNDAIQEIISAKALYKGDVVGVVTNKYFTKSAKELAIANEVILIDRDRLENLIIKASNKQLGAI